MLLHADWGGRAVIEGAYVLDVFAGTGALGLEALSRGAASACFMENDAAALKALRANISTCRAERQAEIVARDVLQYRPRPIDQDKKKPSLVFLDPPYAENLVPRAMARLRDVGLIAPHALIVAETARDDTWLPEEPVLADRQHGAARVLIFLAA